MPSRAVGAPIKVVSYSQDRQHIPRFVGDSRRVRHDENASSQAIWNLLLLPRALRTTSLSRWSSVLARSPELPVDRGSAKARAFFSLPASTRTRARRRGLGTPPAAGRDGRRGRHANAGTDSDRPVWGAGSGDCVLERGRRSGRLVVRSGGGSEREPPRVRDDERGADHGLYVQRLRRLQPGLPASAHVQQLRRVHHGLFA